MRRSFDWRVFPGQNVIQTFQGCKTGCKIERHTSGISDINRLDPERPKAAEKDDWETFWFEKGSNQTWVGIYDSHLHRERLGRVYIFVAIKESKSLDALVTSSAVPYRDKGQKQIGISTHKIPTWTRYTPKTLVPTCLMVQSAGIQKSLGSENSDWMHGKKEMPLPST